MRTDKELIQLIIDNLDKEIMALKQRIEQIQQEHRSQLLLYNLKNNKK